MPREDNLSSRFDYLFEPLDDEESADTVDSESAASGTSSEATPSPLNRAPRTATAPAVTPRQQTGPQPEPTVKQREAEARAPFPNQEPQRGGDARNGGGGGLLGRGGLL